MTDTIGIRSNRIIHTYPDGSVLYYVWDLYADRSGRDGWLLLPPDGVTGWPIATENPDEMYSWLPATHRRILHAESR